MVLSVKMPSRGDTLQWLGDNVKSLSGKVADILKLDVSITASPATSANTPQLSHRKVEAEELTHPEVIFSGSFSPESAHRPTADFDAVADAVGKLTIMSAADVDASEPNVSSERSVALAAAAAPMEDAAIAGAVGGRNNDSLLSMLAQFADEMVRRWIT